MAVRTQITREDRPGQNLVEFRVTFPGHEYAEAVALCQKYGDHLDAPISEDTPLADHLQNLQMLMYRLEQNHAAKP